MPTTDKEQALDSSRALRTLERCLKRLKALDGGDEAKEIRSISRSLMSIRKDLAEDVAHEEAEVRSEEHEGGGEMEKSFRKDAPGKGRTSAKPPEEERLPEGAHRTPPEGYPKERHLYAIPEWYALPIDTEKRARDAASRFPQMKEYDAIPEPQKKKIWGRIVRAQKRFGVMPGEDTLRRAGMNVHKALGEVYLLPDVPALPVTKSLRPDGELCRKALADLRSTFSGVVLGEAAAELAERRLMWFARRHGIDLGE